MDEEAQLLVRRLEREKKARGQAEAIIEARSRELYLKTQELDQKNQELASTLASLGVAFEKLGAAEDIVRRERDFAGRLLDTARVAILVVDAEGRIARPNDFTAALTGWAVEELRGRHASEVLFAPESAASAAELLAAPASDSTAKQTLTLVTRDGELRKVEWSRAELGGAGATGQLTLLVGHDVTERERLFGEVERLSNTDPLTNLPNRRHFEAEGRRQVALAHRHHRPLAAIMVDVDHFKHVNDTWGHHSGDLVLKGVAAVCTRGARATDLRGRLGGEEFCLLLPETDVSGAATLAERLRAEIAATEYEAEGRQLHVTASFGAAQLVGAGTLEDLLAAADRALYEAKTTGRNRVVIVSAEDDTRARAKAGA